MGWPRFAWTYIAYRKDLLAAVLGCAAVMAVAELSIPWLIKVAIDGVLDEQHDINLHQWALLTIGIMALVYGVHVLLLRVDARMLLHCSYNLRQRLFTHIHSQALPFFQRHRTGELIHRVTSDTKIFETETAELFRDVPAELLVLVGVITLMLLLHPGLALAVIVFMTATAAVASYLGQPLPSLRKSAQRLMAGLSARLQEGISGVRTVQGFKNEGYELARLDSENRKILDVELRESYVYALMEPLGDLLEFLGLILVVWYGGHLILAQEITAGTLVAFIAYMEILARPLGRIEGYFRSIQSSRAVAERLQELLNDRDRLPAHGKRSVADGAREIELQDVSFRHPGSDRDVIRDISFKVEPGEVIAVTGRNGAGKSTLIDLLLRFYDPTSGRILVGGIDLKEWDLELWRRSAGIMTQDVFLFHGTILENIAYGRPDARCEEIDQAVRDAGLDRILSRLPVRLETIVGERGTQLSGGERQSIALARLFLRQAKLLILDEPTSQLDGEALHYVRAALRPLLTRCTAFIVSHDLDTIQLAHRVLFLEDGRLAGDGAHEDLYAKNAQYKALWKNEDSRLRMA